MLSIKEFAENYSLSPSRARHLIRQGHLRSELLNGRHLIKYDEAERWLSQQGWRGRVRNISRPDMPPVVLGKGDLLTLISCTRPWNIGIPDSAADIASKNILRLDRLRSLGFEIDLCPSGKYAGSYRLKDVVEITMGDTIAQCGPHPAHIWQTLVAPWLPLRGVRLDPISPSRKADPP